MTVLDKVMFWKKDDFSDLKLDSSFGSDLTGLDSGSGNLSSPSSPSADPFGSNPEPNMPQMPSMSQDLGTAPQSHTSMPSMGAEPNTMPGLNSQTSANTFAGENNYLNQEQIRSQQLPNESSNMSSHEAYLINKNIEVISSKLDALRASLDAMNQRLSTIERVALGEEETRHRGW